MNTPKAGAFGYDPAWNSTSISASLQVLRRSLAVEFPLASGQGGGYRTRRLRRRRLAEHLTGAGPPLMKLASLLTNDQIILDMKSVEHWDAIVELVDHLVSIGRIPGEIRDEVLDALREREDQVSTGIGSGVAIPHTLSDRIDEVAAVFGRSVEGIDFEALDNAPVHFVVLFVVPRAQYNLHLQTLAAIAKTFANCEIRRRLAAAESRDEILPVLAGEDKDASGKPS